MFKDAVLSDDGVYRYWLSRSKRDPSPGFVTHNAVNFIMLNPSTADASLDDPTIRRCMGFAWNFGFDQLIVTNLFAYRATNPKELIGLRDAIGDGNDNQLLMAAALAKQVICAWGVNGVLGGRDKAVCELLSDWPLYHLGLTNAGHPKHPLYLPKTTKPTLWKAAR
jgi:hypothetical protein